MSKKNKRKGARLPSLEGIVIHHYHFMPPAPIQVPQPNKAPELESEESHHGARVD